MIFCYKIVHLLGNYLFYLSKILCTILPAFILLTLDKIVVCAVVIFGDPVVLLVSNPYRLVDKQIHNESRTKFLEKFISKLPSWVYEIHKTLNSKNNEVKWKYRYLNRVLLFDNASKYLFPHGNGYMW